MPVFTVDQTDFLKVEEIIDTRSGTPFSSSYVRNYVRTFLVVTKDAELGASYVCGADPIPRPFAIYQTADGNEYDLFAVLVSYDCKRMVVDGHYHWTVICNYSTEVPEEGIPAAPFDTEIGRETFGPHNEPWTRPAVWRWDWEETTWCPPADLDGRAFLNSARQPFSPPPTFPIARLVLVVEQFEQFFDREIASAYAYAVNADVFLGAPAGCAQCLPIRSEPRNLGPLPYYKNTYRVRFGLPRRLDYDDPTALLPWDGVDPVVEDVIADLQSFQPHVLDSGFCTKAPAGAPHELRPRPVFRAGGHITQPILLDGAGAEKLPEVTGEIIPHFLKFRAFQSKVFAPIISGGVF